MNKAYFFAGLRQPAGAVVPPIVLTNAEAYRQRVLADGGVIFSQQAVVDAFAKAAEWGLPAGRTHWSSPQFGYKTIQTGLIKRYCLFGKDAANGGNPWQLVAPSATGKPPQMNSAKVSFVTPGWDWQDKTASFHAVITPTAYTNSNAPYPYFPIIEQAGTNTEFLLSFEQGTGFEFGFVSPSQSIVNDNGSFPPTGQIQALAGRIDPAQTTAANQRRAWINGREITGQAANSLLSPGAFTNKGLILGSRFTTAYSFVGNINDVLVTNALLSDAARAWLDSQKNAY